MKVIRQLTFTYGLENGCLKCERKIYTDEGVVGSEIFLDPFLVKNAADKKSIYSEIGYRFNEAAKHMVQLVEKEAKKNSRK